ncbi:Short-chain dehydrogenase/reductase tropG [Colletotrichum spinosum]|uniref:Short-chain dehydrogenase/reductase tropG n=1 Tax=Colletotrichum spinosum TaxID=1347390 RepID=A0A4R8QQ48_9PEZI|nr:Short-chain dehydrogenase/reductase tropG [Colletotrichum spinosum]
MTGSIDLPPKASAGTFSDMMYSAFCVKAVYPPKELSLAGQTAIVTGSNSGLGLTCSRMLLAQNLSRLIMPVRSVEKGEAAAEELRKNHPAATVEVWTLDMASYKSVQAFAERCSALDRIDYVILNSGIAKQTFDLSPEGHEESLQVNYISTALLAILLLPVLKARKPTERAARMTIVSSGTSFIAKFPQHDKPSIFAALDDPETFDFADRYSTTKLLGHHFMAKFVGHVRREDVVVDLVEPGLCKGTGLHRHTNAVVRAAFGMMKAVTGRSPEEGAAAYIDAAVLKGPEAHGCYVQDWAIHPFANFLYTPEGRAATEKLWDETLKELDFAGVRSILGLAQ